MSAPRIVEFLAIVADQIRSPALRRSTEEELSSHLADSVDDLKGRGVPEEEAVELAVLKLGDPRALGQKIRRANRPNYLRFSFLAVAGLAFGLPAALGGTLLLEQSIRSHLEERSRDKDRYRQAFLEDQKLLSENEFFGRVSPNEHDAGPFLNPKIVWEQSPQQSAPWPELEFSREASKVFWQERRLGRTWLQIDPNRFARVNTAWMSELSRFDHWDLLSGPVNPMNTHVAQGKGPFSVPMPKYNDLNDFVRVRLLQGLGSGKMLPALKDVRQLARLVYTSETLISSMVAVGMLNLERSAYEEALRRNLLRKGEWAPISAELSARARRSLYDFQVWLDLVNAPEQAEAILQAPHAPGGLCGALSELGNSAWFTRSFLEPRVPLESDHSAWLAKLDQLLHHTPGCRLTLAKAYWNSPPHAEEEMAFVFSSDPVQLFWNFGYFYGANIPYLRRVVWFHSLGYTQMRASQYERSLEPGRELSGK